MLKKIIYVSIVSIAIIISSYHVVHWVWDGNMLLFLQGMVHNPLQVGAFTPCSRFVAEEITKYVKQASNNNNLRVLEVGAGSGIFTKKLEKVLSKKNVLYHLDVIEIDSHYCEILHKRFDKNKSIQIHCTNIMQWKPTDTYDFIISALPFALLSYDMVTSICLLYQQWIKPEGILSYYEHMWLPELKKHFLSGPRKSEYEQKRDYLKEFKKQYVFEKHNIWANITPVRVYHAQFND